MEPIYPANQIVGLHTSCNPLFHGKDKLARALIKENSTPAVSYAPIPAPAQASAPAPASAPDLLERYMNENLQRVTQLTLELLVEGQEYSQL